jgi:glycine/D-amino acid oxidase-like deaminating enzyme
VYLWFLNFKTLEQYNIENMVDFLIVGQGLAGSMLAWELIQRGAKVLLVDNGMPNASQVAAGLINPITGMRFVKSADVDVLLPAAKAYYSLFEQTFGQTFYVEKPMLRIFKDKLEIENATKRFDDASYKSYIKENHLQNEYTGTLNAPLGIVEQEQTGYLLTQPLLECLKAFFIDKGAYLKSDFKIDELQLEPTLRWRDMESKQVIFCEGYQAIQNPWFSWLPFQPVKGEIITVEHSHQLADKMVNFGNWLIPLNDHQARIGATFDRENLNAIPTDSAKEELMLAVNQLMTVPFESHVIRHEANVRPTTLDRNPYLGLHPENNKLAIFNGFGSKGSLQIPWYSQHFSDFLLKNKPLKPSCDIKRHTKKFFVAN